MQDLIDILDTMDIPKMRKDVTDVSNLRWLSRNMFIRNIEHPRFVEASRMVDEALANSEDM